MRGNVKVKVCLVVIYNHQYDKNISKINKIYGGRFTKIIHCMPFYKGKEDNVVPIYESSYSYSGYIAQASRDFISDEYDYYMFLGDDCILNPVITENNMVEKFDLWNGEAYIKSLETLTKDKILLPIPFTNYWLSPKGIISKTNFDDNNHLIYLRRAYGKLKDTREFKVEKYIPSKEEMKRVLKRHGVSFNGGGEYPILISFSDLVIVPRENIKRFVKLCGAFAAANLHVELAIPTALAISCDKIKTENELRLNGKYGLQNHVNMKIISINNLNRCFNNDNVLFVHPIKLSMCKE